MPDLAFLVERDVAVPMRDGVLLRADVYRPADSVQHPVLLQRTPYNKSLNTNALLMLDVNRATAGGYAVVVQDTRGRFMSDGEFTPFFAEVSDGYDTVEWCARQRWSDGNVGMYGASYVGATQWLAAAAAPPHLRAIFPQITSSRYDEGWTYQGGAFALGFVLSWTMTALAPDSFRRIRRERPEVAEAFREMVKGIDELGNWFRYLPMSEFPLFGPAAPYFKEWVEHPAHHDYWDPVRVETRHDSMTIPAYHVGGWYDPFLRGTIANFLGVRGRVASSGNSGTQRLLIGPWSHSVPFTNVVGEVDYGVGSCPPSVDIDGLQLRWFDHWLKGAADEVNDDPPISVFVMGINKWRNLDDWPPPGTRFLPWYLHSTGKANSLRGNGSLSTEPPEDEPYDIYVADPRYPVPTRGGGLCCWPGSIPGGAFDQTLVEERDDVLVYTSDVLSHDQEVIGPISVVLYAASSAPDTDFCAKLVDIQPNGFARNLCDGILRSRYRESQEKTVLLEPERVYEFEIDLVATANTFRAGHRIRLEIAGSNFPRFDRNPQTGEHAGTATCLAPALQRVFHDSSRPSRLLLPVNT